MAIDRAGTTTSRLTVDDWVQAGFAILAEEGIKALKFDRLCRRLAVTKGSFYWHFTDIAGYRSTLMEARGELRDDDRRHFGEMAPIPPRERLSQMMSALLSARHWTLERAMREWARTDVAVAASVRAADHILASAEPSVVTAWQSLDKHLSVISAIAAVSSQFGPRLGNFPMITEYSNSDGFALEDRAICCTYGPLPTDSAVFRRPDQGHRTSPWFRLPLKLHSIESAQARYREWAADEFDRLHSGPQESWIVARTAPPGQPLQETVTT